MERTTATSLPSEDLMSGTDTGSNLCDIDVDQALHEFGIGSTSLHATELNPSGGPQPGEDVPISSESDGGGDGVSVEEPDGPLSAESSDSDVIHIDLTQRPPPLPMSGMALEQIVSMLPGSTYALSGSGIPMRTSPRTEPHQPSPAARASRSPYGTPSAKRASASGIAPSSAADSSQRPAGSPEAQGTPEPQPLKAEEGPGPAGSAALHSSSSGGGSAAAGTGGSPRMALTFIPGLGLVPVVIHDVFDDDEEDGVLEDEAYDMEDSDGPVARPGDPGLGVVIEEHRSDEGADVAASPLAIDPISDDDDSGVSGGDTGAQTLAAAFKMDGSSSGYDEDFEQDVQPLPVGGSDVEAGSPPGTAGGGAGPERSGARPETPGTGGGASAAVARSPYDISEEQLRDIIQQAVHGLAFGQDDLDELFEEDMLDEDDGGVDAQAGLSGGSEGASGSPTGQDAAGRAAGRRNRAGYLSIEALYGNPQQTEADGDGAAAAGQGEDTYDDDDFEDTGPDTADDDMEQEGEEVAEDVGNKEEEDCADEVDDSGSGGAEEPDSILGGLRRPRFGCASENAAPASCHPELGQVLELDLASARAAAAVALATGSRPSGGAAPESRASAGGADRDDTQAAAAAAHRKQPSGGTTAGVALPRPRYISNFMAAYDEVPSHILAGSYRPSAQPTPEVRAAPAARAPEGYGSEHTGAAAAATATAVDGSAGSAIASGPSAAAAAPRGAALKGPNSHNFGALFPTPFAGGVLGSLLGGGTGGDDHGASARAGSSGGSDLNSTMRTSSQSLTAIRLAALQAEGQRQAKAMAERLGGGGDDRAKPAAGNTPAGAPTHHAGISSHAAGSVSRSGAAHILNPFGSAGHEASAAAGLTQLRPDSVSSNNLNRTIRRSGASGSSSSHAGLEGAGHPWPQPGESEEEEDVGDILRDRPIIQARYPTDVKADQRQHDHHHHHHHDHRHDQTTRPGSKDVSGGLLASREVDDGERNGRPRHRRSFELVDLDKIAPGDADAAHPAVSSPTGSSGSSNGSGGGSSPRSPPARSLLATRKSDDEVLPQPMPSSSPRMDDDDDRGSVSSSSSSSAHSVADEKLVDELEALREELSQKTTLVAGLRGELRKYTELAVRLEHQLGALRSQAQVQLLVGEEGPESTKARNQCQSETSTVGRLEGAAPAAPSPAPAAPPTPGQEQHPEQQPQGGSGALHPPPPAAPGSQLVDGTPAAAATPVPAPAVAAGVNGAVHHLPPHPQAQGLDGAARLALYEEILSQAQLQVARCGGPAPPDLQDVQELLAGKDKSRLELDAGSEKVMLIKVRKMVTWGCEAAWKATMAQQQTRHAEQAARQAQSAWEAERERLRQALEAARAGTSFSSSSPSDATGPTRAGGKAATTDGDGAKDLRQQLASAQVQLAAAQEQVSELDSVVASLNADVRKLRSQLRNSRDGSPSHPAEPASPSPADSMAWNMERQLLLSRIAALEQQLREARVADEAETGGATTRPAPTEVAMDRVRQLEERDEALAVNAELRQQLRDLQEALATAAAGGPGQGLGLPVDVEQQRRELEQLQRELEAARQALQRRTAEAQAEHAEQCGVLRAQVVELRRELAASASDAAAAIGRLEEENKVLQAAGADAASQEVLARRLQEQLMAAEAEVEGLRAELSQQVASREELEAQLQRLRFEGLADKESKGAAVQGKEPGVWERIKVLSAEEDAAATIDALSQALKSEARERGRLQQLLDSTTRELGQAESQLRQVHTATSELQGEASQAQAQAAQLQTVLAQVQRERADAEAAAARVKAEVEELRAYVAGMDTENQELRTALAAEDKVQLLLRDQVASLEGELEARASLSQQVPSHRAAAVEEQAVAAGSTAEMAAEGVVAMARAEVQVAEQRAAAAEARVADAQRCLADALQRCEQAAQQGAELQRRLAEEAGQRQRAERALQEARDELAELRSWQQDSASRESVFATWLSALAERLREVDLDRKALQREASELLVQLVASTPRLGAAAPPLPQRGSTTSAGGAAAAVAASGTGSAAQPTTSPPTKALLVADLARLQSELERLRSAAVEAGSRGSSLGGAPEAVVGAGRPLGAAATPLSLSGGGAKDAVRDAAAAKRADALEEQLRGARMEAQTLRAELQGARVELAVKAELLAAKDRSLSTLQETVDALKVALQVTQQNLQATPILSPRDSARSGSGEPDEQKYRGYIAELQSKFEGSESTIRGLQRQVAALETRFSDGGRPAAGDGQQPSTEADAGVADLRLQLKEREEENGRLRRDMEQLRSQVQAPRSPGVGGSIDAGAGSVSAATVNELQMQVLQWRALSEDVHARYQSKKETVRRMREQLASEQQRHVDEQARGQAQLEAARQRLARLATELGTALRRCIAMDLQPLSTTTLTTSPRSQLGGGDVPDDITALAALLARQGTALVESLETALDQVTSAREERSLLLAQLAHRQAVLDELRHHLVRQTAPSPTAADAASGASPSSPGGWAGSGLQHRSSFSPTKPGETRTALFAASSVPVGGLHTTTAVIPAVSPPASSATATDLAAAAAVASKPAVPTLSPSKSLQAAALNLAQDMAALSVQQAGLRSTLHQFEQRQAQQQQQGTRPRSFSAMPFGTGPTAYPATTALGTYASLGQPGMRTAPRSGSAGSGTDGLLSYGSVSTGSAVPHSFVGILSGGRAAEAGSSGGGGLHTSTRPLTGLYQQQQAASPALASTVPASLYDVGRLHDSVAPLASSSSIPTYARGAGAPVLGVGTLATMTTGGGAGMAAGPGQASGNRRSAG